MGAVRTAVALAALLVAGACGPGPPEPGEDAKVAHAAWKIYRDHPAADTYHNFIRLNAAAARVHAQPDDAPGLEYRCRALEVMAAEAERTNDPVLGDQTVEQVNEIERRELFDVYDETLRGSKARFVAARARAARVVK